jgi:hypothetical protein
VNTKFTASFDAVFADVGIAVLRSPPGAPKANAYAERWVTTIRRECLDRMLIFHERQLRQVLTDYEDHYNTHRPHRALEQRSPMGLTRIDYLAPLSWSGVHRSDQRIPSRRLTTAGLRFLSPTRSKIVSTLAALDTHQARQRHTDYRKHTGGHVIPVSSMTTDLRSSA